MRLSWLRSPLAFLWDLGLLSDAAVTEWIRCRVCGSLCIRQLGVKAIGKGSIGKEVWLGGRGFGVCLHLLGTPDSWGQGH